MNEETESLKARLDALEEDDANGRRPRRHRGSPLTAIGGVAAIAALGAGFYLLARVEGEDPFDVAAPDEFQTDGGDFGEIEPALPPTPPPSAETTVVVEADTEPNAELLGVIAGLQAELVALRNQPAVEDDKSAQAGDRRSGRSTRDAASDLQGGTRDLAERDRRPERGAGAASLGFTGGPARSVHARGHSHGCGGRDDADLDRAERGGAAVAGAGAAAPSGGGGSAGQDRVPHHRVRWHWGRRCERERSGGGEAEPRRGFRAQRRPACGGHAAPR